MYGMVEYLVGQIAAANPKMTVKAIVTRAENLIDEIDRRREAREKAKEAKRAKEQKRIERVVRDYKNAFEKDRTLKNLATIHAKAKEARITAEKRPYSTALSKKKQAKYDAALQAEQAAWHALKTARDTFRERFAKRRNVHVNRLH